MLYKSIDELKLAVVGLGYVGLPLAVEFGKFRDVIGFDLDESRINSLREGEDTTNEVSKDEIKTAVGLKFTSNISSFKDVNTYIVTVPTPVDLSNNPDLKPLIKATEMIGTILKNGDIVIYESTVYPGASEEVCAPILERCSGLKFNEGFFIGYSPERINPGDLQHRLPTICKVTSGSTEDAAILIDNLYSSIIVAGTYKAENIRVAEAAKVIENTQRDLNIALMNELSIIFSRLGIDTASVLKAAGTKWNFLRFQPGLVGGHCIGVDPYYLTYKAQQVGYYPEMLLAGRRINDGMATHVAMRLVKGLIAKDIPVRKSRILILGYTFKENCPDTRNTKVQDLINELVSFGIEIELFDPWVNNGDLDLNGCCKVLNELGQDYDAVVLAVAHKEFANMSNQSIRKLCRTKHVIFDLKSVLDFEEDILRL